MAKGDQAQRSRGRPRLNPIEGNRRNVTSQLSVELYDKLKEASEKSGLSISREFEKRIEESFREKPPTETAVLNSDKAQRDLIDQAWAHFSIVVGGRDMVHAGMMFAILFARAITVANRTLGNEFRWYESQDKKDFVIDFFSKSLPRVVNGLAEDARDGFPIDAGPGSLLVPHRVE